MSYALITGAAKGIGRAMAIELAKRGYDLLLTDWDVAALSSTITDLQTGYSGTFRQFTQDLSFPDAAGNLKAWSAPYHKELEVVINNAGYGLNAPFEQLDISAQLNIIDVNVKAQLAVTHAFLPVLASHKRSYLLNVCSTTAYQPVPYLSVYAASKAFVLSFNRSLHYELRNSTVSLSYLSPGSTDTHFVIRAGMQEHTLRLARRFNMTAEEVARIAIKGLFKGKEEIIPGFLNKLNAYLPKFFPVSLVRKIGAGIYEPRPSVPPSGEAQPVLSQQPTTT